MTSAQLLRSIPSVTEFLSSPPGRALCEEFGDGMVKLELRGELEAYRESIRNDHVRDAPTIESLGGALKERLIRLLHPIGRRAINATGILLHTGLGRSPLCDDAIDALAGTLHYSLLQASLDRGDRSLREEKLQRMLIELVGCQAATIVNNNAAATMLILNSLAAGKEVIISRGQLIEIGGSFRMTDVMAQSSAILREVGTTNRTHLRDYASAISESTGAIIHVHTSNYRIRGFTGTPEIGELVELGRKHKIRVIDDLGSGALVPLDEFGLANEPLVRDSLAAGANVVCFSGDKLICGPQCGIICGRDELIQKIRRNPFARMFRVCKLTLAAMEATLPHFINAPAYKEKIPFYRMLSRSFEDVRRDAISIAQALDDIPGMEVSVADDLAYVGSGSIPDEGIKTSVVRVVHAGISASELAKRLRMGMPSVFARLQDRMLVLDPRTLLAGEVEIVIAKVKEAAGA